MPEVEKLRGALVRGELVPFEQAQEMLAIEPRPLRETAPRNERRRTSKEQSFAPCRSHPEGRAARMESKEQSSVSVAPGRAAFLARCSLTGMTAYVAVAEHRTYEDQPAMARPPLQSSTEDSRTCSPWSTNAKRFTKVRWTLRRTASGSATPWGPSGTPSSPTRPSGSPRALLGTCGSQRELRRAGLPDPARLQPGLLPPGRGGVATLFLERAAPLAFSARSFRPSLKLKNS